MPWQVGGEIAWGAVRPGRVLAACKVLRTGTAVDRIGEWEWTGWLGVVRRLWCNMMEPVKGITIGIQRRQSAARVPGLL